MQAPQVDGLVVEGAIGFAAAGAVWSARTTDGDAVALRMLPGVDDVRRAARYRRLETVRRVSHGGLAGLVELLTDGEQDLMVSELVPGPTLATVRAGRMGLSAAEALGLARALAAALAELHAAGIAHGDVAPANVVLRADRDDAAPVLVDLGGEPGWEAGTPGFAAPEVRRGAVATPRSDVWSLATVCLWATGPTERHAVAGVLHRALADDPADRPVAADLHAQLADVEVVPVRVPPSEVLAGARLREQAQRETTRLRPGRRRPRHRRRNRARLVGSLVAVALVLAVGGVVALRATNQDTADAGPDLVSRVPELVTLRDKALEDGDADALAAVTVPGSPAAAQDAALLSDLAGTATVVSELRTVVTGTEVVTRDGDRALVRTVLQQEPHLRHPGPQDPGATQDVPGQRARCVELSLLLADGEWRVQQTGPCSV